MASFQHLLGVGSEPTPAQCLFQMFDCKFISLCKGSCNCYAFLKKKVKGMGLASNFVGIEYAKKKLEIKKIIVIANSAPGCTVQ